MAAFAFNSAPQASLGISPLHLLLGRPARGPWSLPPLPLDDNPASEHFLQRRRELEQRAVEKLFQSQVRMVVFANMRAAERAEVEVGSLVFVDADDIPDPREKH